MGGTVSAQKTGKLESWVGAAGGRWYNGGAPAGGVAGRSSNGKSYEPEPVKGSGMKNDHPEGVP